MPGADPVHELTSAWLDHAATDIRTATVLEHDADELASSTAFHAQQAIEKCLKAVLVAAQVDFRRTHQLAFLADLVPPGWDLDLPVDELARVSQFAAETRYPIDDWNEVEPVSADEARRAVDLARAVYAQVSARLRARGIVGSERSDAP